MTKILTFELSEEQAEYLHSAARQEERSMDELIGDLVDQRMEYDVWFKRSVQAGLDELDRGEFVTHEDVRAHLETLKAALVATHGGD